MEDGFTTSKATDYKQVNDEEIEKKKKKDTVQIDINQFLSKEEEDTAPKKKKKGKKGKGTEPKEEEKKEDKKEEQEEEKVTKPKSAYPQNIVFCGLCGWPTEYCEYGAKSAECTQWLKTNNEEEYKKLYSGEEKVEAKKEEGKKQKKKVAFKEQMMLVVIKKNRTPKKYITCVKGFHTFGIDLKDAAKKLCKKMASGATVSKDDSGEEMVQVQGDIFNDMDDFIKENYPQIKPDQITYKDESTKKKKEKKKEKQAQGEQDKE